MATVVMVWKWVGETRVRKGEGERRGREREGGTERERGREGEGAQRYHMVSVKRLHLCLG